MQENSEFLYLIFISSISNKCIVIVLSRRDDLNDQINQMKDYRRSISTNNNDHNQSRFRRRKGLPDASSNMMNTGSGKSGYLSHNPSHGVLDIGMLYDEYAIPYVQTTGLSTTPMERKSSLASRPSMMFHICNNNTIPLQQQQQQNNNRSHLPSFMSVNTTGTGNGSATGNAGNSNNNNNNNNSSKMFGTGHRQGSFFSGVITTGGNAGNAGASSQHFSNHHTAPSSSTLHMHSTSAMAATTNTASSTHIMNRTATRRAGRVNDLGVNTFFLGVNERTVHDPGMHAWYKKLRTTPQGMKLYESLRWIVYQQRKRHMRTLEQQLIRQKSKVVKFHAFLYILSILYANMMV